MEPETVPAKALVGARERVEALTKSMTSLGTEIAGAEFDAPDFRLEIEAAPEPQAALGMALAQAKATQARLAKAANALKARADKAESEAKEQKVGGDAAFARATRMEKALIRTGAYTHCPACKGLAKAADGKACEKCEDGLVKRSAKR